MIAFLNHDWFLCASCGRGRIAVDDGSLYVKIIFRIVHSFTPFLFFEHLYPIHTGHFSTVITFQQWSATLEPIMIGSWENCSWSGSITILSVQCDRGIRFPSPYSMLPLILPHWGLGRASCATAVKEKQLLSWWWQIPLSKGWGLRHLFLVNHCWWIQKEIKHLNNLPKPRKAWVNSCHSSCRNVSAECETLQWLINCYLGWGCSHRCGMNLKLCLEPNSGFPVWTHGECRTSPLAQLALHENDEKLGILLLYQSLEFNCN